MCTFVNLIRICFEQSYQYLGLILIEFLNYYVMAKALDVLLL